MRSAFAGSASQLGRSNGSRTQAKGAGTKTFKKAQKLVKKVQKAAPKPRVPRQKQGATALSGILVVLCGGILQPKLQCCFAMGPLCCMAHVDAAA